MHPMIRKLLELARMAGDSFEMIDAKAGYTTGTLSRWSAGSNNPRLIAFFDYAQAVGHTLELTPTEPIFIPKFLPLRRRQLTN